MILTGCSAVPHPNRPSETVYTSTLVQPDGTKREVRAEYVGTENETRSAPVRVSPDGALDIGQAKSVQFDWDIGVSDAYIWIGAGIAVLGAVLMVAPIPVPFVKACGVPLIVIGSVLALMPIVAPQVRLIVLIGGLLALAGGVVYGLWKLGVIKARVSPDAIAERVKKGDLAGAATMVFAATGDKDKARAVKQPAKGVAT